MYLKVRVITDAKEEKLEDLGEGVFRISVREPARRGLSNRAVLKLIAARLGARAGLLRIIKGAHSPSKIIEWREK